MRTSIILCVVLACIGCSGASAKRVMYDSVQNKAQMDCQKDPGAKCPEPMRYDDYQRQREQGTPGR